jgi:hypothetical protein
VDLSRLGYRSSERGGIPHESSPLLAKVFRALRDDSVPPARIAAELALTLAELNSHVSGLIPTALTGGSDQGPRRHPDLRLLT